MPYNLTPLEEQQLTWLQQNYPKESQAQSMFFDILGGAQDRFAQNQATRQQGMAGLREMAMQLAASGASETALAGAIGGQADALPGVGAPGVSRMEDYVSGLYGEGPVSGLAPLDMRGTGVAGVIDDDDRAAIAGQVNQLMTQGANFTDIREQVRRAFIAQGYDEFSTSEAEAEAQSAYERLIGGSLGEMRGLGEELRSEFGTGTGALSPGGLAEYSGIPESRFDFGGDQPGAATDVKGFLAAAVNDPELYQQLLAVSDRGSQSVPRPAYAGGLPRGGVATSDPYGLNAYTRRG